MSVLQPVEVIEHLKNALSPSTSLRTSGEHALLRLSSHPGFLEILIGSVVQQPSLPLDIRISAAVLFKNIIRKGWHPHAAGVDESSPAVLDDNTRAQIRDRIVDIMLSIREDVLRKQLIHAVTLIAEFDFPASWPQFLSVVAGKLSSLLRNTTFRDVSGVNALLEVADIVFHKYREQSGSEQIVAELLQILALFAPVLLDVADFCNAAPVECMSAGVAFHLLSIFVSLNWIELPEFFEDNIERFLRRVFLPWLASDVTPGPTKSEILVAAGLYAERYEQEFEPFAGEYLGVTWNLLKTTKDESAVISLIRFLTNVARSTLSDRLQGNIPVMLEQVVVPNVILGDEDLDQFEEDAIEFIRRDIEGGDVDSRRRAAADLLRALVSLDKAQVSAVIQQVAEQLFLMADGVVAASPKTGVSSSSRRRNQESALYLIQSVAALKYNQLQGCTELNDRVDVGRVFSQFVVPILSAAPSAAEKEGPETGIMQAAALKFLHVFRAQLPVDAFPSLVAQLCRFLQSKYAVVYSYAAIVLERMLVLKESAPVALTGAGGAQGGPGTVPPPLPKRIYSPDSYLQPILAALFGTLTKHQEEENIYLMRCCRRVCACATPSLLVPLGHQCIEALSVILMKVCKNPSQPVFSHELFETFGVLLKSCCVNENLLADFETHLFPCFNIVLQTGVEDFTPYVFQIMAFLLHQRYQLHMKTLPASYAAMIPPILHPSMWSKHGFIPALVQYLCAALRLDPSAVLGQSPSVLESILGVAQKLISSKPNDHHAFQILMALLSTADGASRMAPYMAPLFQVLLNRLQSAKTPKYAAEISVFILFCLSRGVDVGAVLNNNIQPGLFQMLLQAIVSVSLVPLKDDLISQKIVAAGALALLKNDQWRSMYLLSDPQLCNVFATSVASFLSESAAHATGAGAGAGGVAGIGFAGASTASAADEFGGLGGGNGGDDFEMSTTFHQLVSLSSSARFDYLPSDASTADMLATWAQQILSFKR